MIQYTSAALRKNWYINFTIKKYDKIDDTLKIIGLIDKNICTEEKIYGTYIIIKIERSYKTYHDYKSETNILCDSKFIEDYLCYKFKLIVNMIKYNFVEFGDNWYIEFNNVAC